MGHICVVIVRLMHCHHFLLGLTGTMKVGWASLLMLADEGCCPGYPPWADLGRAAAMPPLGDKDSSELILSCSVNACPACACIVHSCLQRPTRGAYKCPESGIDRFSHHGRISFQAVKAGNYYMSA